MLEEIKQWFSVKKEASHDEVTFGRFSDFYKEKSKYQAWDDALEYCKNNDFLSFLKSYISYLSHGDGNNVSLQETKQGHIEFSCLQGSKKMYGVMESESIKVYAPLVSFSEAHLGIFRTLLEENYRLNYTKYIIEDDIIIMVFESYLKDLTPYKLYYGMKEMALIVDHKDDALILQHNTISAVSDAHLQQVTSHVALVKYEYFKELVATTRRDIEEYGLTSLDAVSRLAFVCGAFAYKTDYLIRPEAQVMYALERLIVFASATDAMEMHSNVPQILQIFEELNTYDFDTFKKELYIGIYTFGVTVPIDHIGFVQLMQGGLQYFHDTEIDNPELRVRMCDYLLGKTVYEKAPPPYFRDLVNLYYQATNPSFFNKLGYEALSKEGLISILKVQKKINEILNNYHVTLDTAHLPTQETKADFAMAFINMLSAIKNP